MRYSSGIYLPILTKIMENLSGLNATAVLDSKNEVNDMNGNKSCSVNKYKFNSS